MAKLGKVTFKVYRFHTIESDESFELGAWVRCERSDQPMTVASFESREEAHRATLLLTTRYPDGISLEIDLK